MNGTLADALKMIDNAQSNMEAELRQWVSINTHTLNITGLEALKTLVIQSLQRLTHQVETLNHHCVRACIRPEAPIEIFLSGHMDTVYPESHPFQTLTELEPGIWRGPGVADMKGGLLVMLTAVAALEKYQLCPKLGYQIFINADEEIGSVNSKYYIEQFAKGCDAALAFEPTATVDGALVSERKGSGRYTLIIKGRAAHAGRDFASGRNAIVAASRLLTQISELNQQNPGLTLNIGTIQGGSAVNVVPDSCTVALDLRMTDLTQQTWLETKLAEILEQTHDWDGITVQLEGGLNRPPKMINDKQRSFMTLIESAALSCDLPIAWQKSGGVSDGNNIAALGVPVVDTLGVRGGNIHSSDEFIVLASLSERAKLTATILHLLSQGKMPS